ncbi:hypothetical protein DB43_GF00410 [Parachlamydia acanthamoebae]|uniref:Uncharacterized protein n=1 Tax=Parachlamydia acanthamoebae TaxID=83552 RepID=A0A0C1EM91_9BACT|nr:hypothetical protein DB43_GF00410 [Parachlamydia acanthamoebae]
MHKQNLIYSRIFHKKLLESKTTYYTLKIYTNVSGSIHKNLFDNTEVMIVLDNGLEQSISCHFLCRTDCKKQIL